MKKGKALIVSSALIALSLASCGSNGYYGTYQFQMGKMNETHIGIYMDLTKEMTEVPQEEGQPLNMEKFYLHLDVPLDEAESEGSLIGGILTYFSKDGLSGGYKIDYSEELEKQQLNLHPVINISDLEKAISDSMSEAETEEGSSNPESSSSATESSSEESSSEEIFVIPADAMDDILISTYSGSSIDITVPVSLTDLMFQLYWYGFDLFSEENPTAHPHGSHPTTQEEIDEINKTFNSGIPHFDIDALLKYKTFKTVEFRDFNQLTMTLVKDEK